jgi:phage repressor protein C with HTH and peptisase S24 domain
MIRTDRVIERREAKGITQSELARRVGVSAQAIQKIESGETKRSGYVVKIARELDTTPAYLESETDDPSMEGVALPSASTLAEQLDAVMMREIEIGLSMGGGSLNEDLPVTRMVPISRSWLRGMTDANPADLIVARGEGDSMMPTILDGDLIFINTAERTLRQQDRIWALVYGDFGMVKRVRGLPGGNLQINSDNPAVSAIDAAPDEVNTIGRVVAILRKV